MKEKKEKLPLDEATKKRRKKRIIVAAVVLIVVFFLVSGLLGGSDAMPVATAVASNPCPQAS